MIEMLMKIKSENDTNDVRELSLDMNEIKDPKKKNPPPTPWEIKYK